MGGYYSSTAVVLAPRADESGQYQATVTARLGRTAKSAVITVNPGLAIVQIPASNEPDAVTLNILFTGELPAGGVIVKLASSNPAVSVPSSFAFTQAGQPGWRGPRHHGAGRLPRTRRSRCRSLSAR